MAGYFFVGSGLGCAAEGHVRRVTQVMELHTMCTLKSHDVASTECARKARLCLCAPYGVTV
jgi:hypothetical protein